MIMCMRIDRLLCEMNIGSRSQVKELLRKGLVSADGTVIKRGDTRVDENQVTIVCMGKEYRYRPYVYFMMNKPPGVVTATADSKEMTVLDLFRRQYEQKQGELAGIPVQDIFPAGRLDKDTVGLLVLTNDGALAHEILSPKRHIPKTYFVRTDKAPDPQKLKALEAGILLEEGFLTKPAKVTWQKQTEGLLTITEGKYHQVKRMFQKIGVRVIYLKRISMGGLTLDKDLNEGEIRELTQKEVEQLCWKK